MKRLVNQSMLSASMILILCSPSFAAHPLITDDTGTQGRGNFQLEVNGGYGHNEDDGTTTKESQVSTTLTYGISEPVDIAIGLPCQHIRTEGPGGGTSDYGISDFSLEVKWRFWEKDGLSFALKPGITLPTGDEEKGLGAGDATCHLFFIGTKEIRPWAFDLNLGYIRNQNDIGEEKDIWHASLAATVEVARKLKLAGNIGAERNNVRNLNTPPAFILGGLIYSLWQNFDIDGGVKRGLTRPAENYTLLAGITWRL
ncbi:MAG: transporter [Nitrospiraceae bacterium]|nr:transporter [Nitrospiraceae bacterium]